MSESYEIIELERPRRIVARGTSSQVSGVDTFTVSPTPVGGSEVLYETDIELSGLSKLATPLVGAAVARQARERAGPGAGARPRLTVAGRSAVRYGCMRNHLRRPHRSPP